MERRDFFKEVGAIGGSGMLISAFPWLQSCTSEVRKETAKEKVNLAVIGTGSRGQYHLFNLQKIPQANVVGLCDIYEPHLQAAKAYFPKAKGYSDYREVLDNPAIKAVVITTPLHLHAPITIAALQAGKQVFCEKAMARTPEDCYKVYQAYKASNQVLYIGMQRLFDAKYIKAMSMIHAGLIGKICGVRAYWFRNNDWRRPVPTPDLERQINWRLYKEYSAGLLTELSTHQLQIGNWAMREIPTSLMASGDLVYWKDGREVPDNISMIYHYSNGVKMNYESIISNKFLGLEEEIFGDRGTMTPEKNKYYFEEVQPAPGILQMINDIEHKMFDNVELAGPSWVPETASVNKGEFIMPHSKTTSGSSSTGAAGDGSVELMTAFCQSAITGQRAKNLVEEAYYSSVLALLAERAMDEKKIIYFPDELKIPYLNMK